MADLRPLPARTRIPTPRAALVAASPPKDTGALHRELPPEPSEREASSSFTSLVRICHLESCCLLTAAMPGLERAQTTSEAPWFLGGAPRLRGHSQGHTGSRYQNGRGNQAVWVFPVLSPILPALGQGHSTDYRCREKRPPRLLVPVKNHA